jgi:cell division protein FtsQ
MLLATDMRKRPQAEDVRPHALARLLAGLAQVPLRRAVPLGIAASGAALVLWLMAQYLDRPIAQLQVAGEFQRVAVDQVEAAVKPFRGAGFLSVDLDAVRAAVQGIAWVDHARVARRWPDGLDISLTEHVPAARWGEHGLMNKRGELFLREAQQVPLELPQLLGPEGTQQQVTSVYLEFAPQLLAVGLRLARLQLDARGAWQITLDNGVEVRLGRQDVRSRLERLVHSASALVSAQQNGAIRYIDLRYSNGFSVGWNATARVAHGAEAATSDG